MVIHLPIIPQRIICPQGTCELHFQYISHIMPPQIEQIPKFDNTRGQIGVCYVCVGIESKGRIQVVESRLEGIGVIPSEVGRDVIANPIVDIYSQSKQLCTYSSTFYYSSQSQVPGDNSTSSHYPRQ
ncbi:hypothetical protein FGO68_gene13042 [Halteria grandinella]|uniref:Uncharacterized protein n=1 Tax=Halteria grandinella TaxID=5974 RepID=A0A8J8SXU5_HALGN|nr:hypothetical protein FGO68_gene13042 [Halteria grandinella]